MKNYGRKEGRKIQKKRQVSNLQNTPRLVKPNKLILLETGIYVHLFSIDGVQNFRIKES